MHVAPSSTGGLVMWEAMLLKMKQHSGGDYWSPHTRKHRHCAVHSQCRRAAAAEPQAATHSTTLQSSASEFPQVESCALLPSLSFGGSTKSNCLWGEGTVRMKRTCEEAVQQKCIHPKVCMSVKWKSATVCDSVKIKINLFVHTEVNIVKITTVKLKQLFQQLFKRLVYWQNK